jgi:hypothetical protein
VNYLSPEIRNGPWSDAEDVLLVQKYEEHGKSWEQIGLCFPGRTLSNVRNRWKLLKRRQAGNTWAPRASQTHVVSKMETSQSELDQWNLQEFWNDDMDMDESFDHWL